ncbi:MAG: hypothetical protein WBH59_07325 [Atribacterales bacterium]
MAFIQGRILLPSDTPWARKAAREYMHFEKEEEKTKKLLAPLPDTEIKAFLLESPDLITRTKSNEEGEFFLRVPPGENYFLEFYYQSQLVALAFANSLEEEVDLGTVDSLVTAQALKIKMGEKGSSVSVSELAKNIEQMWARGEGLEKLEAVSNSPVSDPFHLIEYFDFSFLPDGRTLIVNWKSRQPVVARLYYRSFNSSRYHKLTAKHKKEGAFSFGVREFEGYLFYLEMENDQHLLGRTPLRAVRAPLSPEKRKIIIEGREDGPITVARRKVSGERTISFPKENRDLKLSLYRAMEREFEAEMYFNFLGVEEMPRFLVREGFEELEFAIYFPMEFSFLWGPVGSKPGVSISAEDREKILELWRDEELALPVGRLMEIGYSTPFVEVVAYRGGEYFHLFSNTDLKEKIFLFSLRRLDSLDLEAIIYYWGKLTLHGEGMFEDYSLELDLRGRFEEGKEPLLWTFQKGEVEGEIKLWIDLEVTRNQRKGTTL